MSETIAIQLLLPKDTYQALQQAARRQSRSEADLAVTAIKVYLGHLLDLDPFFGLFSEDAALIDQVVQQAMRDRERVPMRLSESTFG